MSLKTRIENLATRIGQEIKDVRGEFLGKTNTTPFSPSADFHPATKKYVDDKSPVQLTGLTLLATGWTLVSNLFQYDLANVNITANSIVEIIPDNDSLETVYNAGILPGVDSSAGSVKIYAVNEPASDIGITVNIKEKAV